MQTHQSAQRTPPRDKPHTPTSLDPHPNPWIKFLTKSLKSPHIPKSRKTQVATRKVQHRLRRYPRNFRQKFRTQAAQNLVDNHLFKLPHDFHIYNKQGKKETIDTILMVSESENWSKAVGNELGRLANGIDNQVLETNTFKFIRKKEVSKGRTFTYANFVCEYRPLKSEPYKFRLSVSGDRL